MHLYKLPPTSKELWQALLFKMLKIMITCPWVSPGGFPGSNRTASPKSASTAVKSFFSKTFLLLKSLRTSQEASLGRVYYGTHLNHTATRCKSIGSAAPSKSAPFLPRHGQCWQIWLLLAACVPKTQPSSPVLPSTESAEVYSELTSKEKQGVIWTIRHHFSLWAPAVDPHLWALLTFLTPNNKCKTG